MKHESTTLGTVYIVDDNPAVRDAIRWLVEQVGLKAKPFGSAQEFLSNFRSDMRGCVVLDIRMPGMSGLELQEKLTQAGAQLPIIIVTGHGDVPITVRAMKAGAFEFLQKPFSDQVLLDAIHSALEKYSAVWEHQENCERARRSLASLTPRELEIMELLRKGKSNKAIALELDLSVRTVEGHRAHITEKMGVKSLGQLIEVMLKSETNNVSE